MNIEQDIIIIDRQEASLCFDGFDEDMAWRVGSQLREHAVGLQRPLVIDIFLNGRTVFACALPGATSNHADWVRRKRNTVLHFSRCSYGVGRQLEKDGDTLLAKFALPISEYVAAGGCFPIRIRKVGVVGTITVSGLPQRDDHMLIVTTLAEILGITMQGMMLD